MFEKHIINYERNLFEELSNSIQYDNVTKGRVGTVLVDCKNDVVPIVRTTTCYNNPAQKFLPIHYDILNKIKDITGIVGLNNALIEIYDSSYRKMGFHSDQALDLEDESHICVFSCYSNPETKDVRKLIIKKKDTGEQSEILMEHNSIICFPLSTNSTYWHKIVLNNHDSMSVNDKWLGITFRRSKTYIKHVDNIPYFQSNNNMLRIANDDEKIKFYKLRSAENKNNGKYTYPELDYTISISDTLYVSA